MLARATLLTLLLCLPAAHAQATLTGRVVDAESGLPLPTATVALWQTQGADSTLAGGATSRIEGDFEVADLAPGRYRLVVSFVGYQDDARALTLADGARDLGTIGLDVAAAALGEVRVRAERAERSARIDRTVYDTADSPVTAGGSATDVLATIPSVAVDIEGNVSLRGSGNVAVFIDGRPAPVSADFVADYLASLPAGSVDRVEVIPNPSAAFEPDGVGGIINIVLKENTDLGLGGTLTAGTTSRGSADASGALTYGRGPWSLAGTYGVRNEYDDGGGTSFRINRYEADPTTLDQRETEDQSRLGHFANLSVDYSLTDAATLSAQGQVSARRGDETELNATLRQASTGALLYESERLATEADDGVSGDLRLGARWAFGEEHRLSAEARTRVSDEAEDQTYDETLIAGAGDDLRAPQRVAETELERERSVQVDYTRPVAGFQLDLGYKGEIEDEDRSLRSESLDAASGAFLEDVAVGSAFEFDETLHSAYAQTAREWGPWGVQAGLRLEQARSTFLLLTTDETFDQDYRSLFPSAFLAFKPMERLTLRGGYSRRINRPGTWQLNPFPSFDDPLNIRQGNPRLRPEYVDAMELSANRLTAWGSLSLTPYYRRTTDVIRRISTVRADGVTVRSAQNLDAADAWGAEGIVSVEELGGFRGFLSLEAYRLQTEGATDEAALSNDAIGWGGRVNASYGFGDRFGWGDLSVQGTARYTAPIDTEQGRAGARVFMDFAVRQKLLGDRASLTLQARDPLGIAGSSFTLDQPDLFQERTRDWAAQQVGLTFSYAFGRQDRERRDAGGERGGGGDDEE